MYRIGEFSEKVGLTVNTLRYYNEIGVLIPSEIDTFTNYRYYSEKNVEEAEFIKLLTSLKFSLAEVVEYKNNLTNEILDNKKQELQNEIDQLNSKIETIEFMKSEIKDNNIKSYSINSKVA